MRASEMEGMVPASPSKSYTHRAILLAALAEGVSAIRRPLISDDTLSTLRGVQQLGVKANVLEDHCIIDGGELCCPEEIIDVGNSGTTLRLLAGVASLLPCTTVLTGDESIQRRPMQPLIEAIREMGAQCVSTRGDGRAPVMIVGPNTGKVAHIRGDVSSQFISSLLLACPLKEVDTDIVVTTPLRSRPYLDITMAMMADFGVGCERTKEGFHVEGGQAYRPTDYLVPGDYSSAAFPLAAGALAGSVGVSGLDPGDMQGDRRILDILRSLGAGLVVEDRRARASMEDLRAADIDLRDCPDLFPIVAVLATQAKGRSVLHGAYHLRFKETDRIRTTVGLLRRMGAEAQETDDGAIVMGPSRLKGTEVDCQGDHRIMMAAAVAALVAEGETVIEGAECHSVSYPGFISHMRSLGADMEVEG